MCACASSATTVHSERCKTSSSAKPESSEPLYYQGRVRPSASRPSGRRCAGCAHSVPKALAQRLPQPAEELLWVGGTSWVGGEPVQVRPPGWAGAACKRPRAAEAVGLPGSAVKLPHRPAALPLRAWRPGRSDPPPRALACSACAACRGSLSACMHASCCFSRGCCHGCSGCCSCRRCCRAACENCASSSRAFISCGRATGSARRADPRVSGCGSSISSTNGANS